MDPPPSDYGSVPNVNASETRGVSRPFTTPRRYFNRTLVLLGTMVAGTALPSTVLTCLSVVGSGVISGLMFAFSTVVMQSLDTLHTEAAVAAMNAINDIIINPLFFVAFFGTAASSLGVLIAAVVKRTHPSTEPMRLVGASVYIVGVILVTMAFNVPLNDKLAQVSVSSTDQQSIDRHVWQNYYRPWMMWNHVRSLSALVATGLLTASLTR